MSAGWHACDTFQPYGDAVGTADVSIENQQGTKADRNTHTHTHQIRLVGGVLCGWGNTVLPLTKGMIPGGLKKTEQQENTCGYLMGQQGNRGSQRLGCPPYGDWPSCRPNKSELTIISLSSAHNLSLRGSGLMRGVPCDGLFCFLKNNTTATTTPPSLPHAHVTTDHVLLFVPFDLRSVHQPTTVSHTHTPTHPHQKASPS